MFSLVSCQETSPAGFHSTKIGNQGINEIAINWTDDKNYTELKKTFDDSTFYDENGEESGLGTYYLLGAYTINNSDNNPKNGKSFNDATFFYDATLHFNIGWHPSMKNAEPSPSETIFSKSPSDYRSSITIQGKKAVLIKFKETKEFVGSDKPPVISPAVFFVRYYPDDYTEVTIRASIAEWKDSDFKNAMTSLKINFLQDYY